MSIVVTALKILGLLFIFYILVLTVCALLADPRKTYTEESKLYRFLLNTATWVVLKCARVRIHVEGENRIPHDSRFLLVSNHLSNFDPIVTWYILRKYQLAFISKPENFKIPWFGRIIRKCCFLPIQRNDIALSIGTFHKAADLMKADSASVAVYPEGTRSKTGALQPFHSVVFYTAKVAKVPVTVMRIGGTPDIKKHFPLHHTDVYITIIETIPKEWVLANDIKNISERAEKDILKSEREMCFDEQDLLYPV